MVFIVATENNHNVILLAIPSFSQVSTKTWLLPQCRSDTLSLAAPCFPDWCNLCVVRYDHASAAICAGVGEGA